MHYSLTSDYGSQFTVSGLDSAPGLSHRHHHPAMKLGFSTLPGCWHQSHLSLLAAEFYCVTECSRCLDVFLNPICVDKHGANATRAGAGCGWWSCIVYSVYEVCDLSYAAMHGPQRTGGRLPSLPGPGHVMVRSWSW